ncbi:hypothetical protein J5226_16975 [Lysobacter sp. K5869]|uniref:sensor histidine kinase n=1 Tax=Lysobacter sp. K5869 TaxID=2820808 RepID=UPI001C061773|nr:ATP-binding protein [Lysobacter sp. K5869]QWP75311.1 hypothetical protein J5226_16975 [Lysobacter sp. K5869]
MTVPKLFPPSWLGFLARVEPASARDPQDRRNARTLAAMLAAIAAATLAMALVPWAANGATAETALMLIVSVYACLCLSLLRGGLFRLATRLVVVGGLVLMAMSYLSYGLRAHSGLQIVHLLPLLIAGLFLGRSAAWWTALANVVVLAIGALADLRLAPGPTQAADTLSNLLLAGTNFLTLVVILDRLVLSTRKAIHRSEELNELCQELQRQVEEKERAYERLLQSQKMEIIGRLSTGIAHDFNAILSVILGHATSVKLLKGSADAVLPGIQQAARRGATLTRRLLSLSRPDARQLSRFDLAEAIEEVRPLILPMFPRAIVVELDTSMSGVLIEADRDELVLALLNIASNACDAMPDGGRFALAVEAEAEHACLRLEDSGAGMSAQVRARLFEPFFTTKPKDKGTGIGMTTVHRFVADHDGDIAVDSAPGQGTRIRIRLPRVRDPGASPSGAGEDPSLPAAADAGDSDGRAGAGSLA